MLKFVSFGVTAFVLAVLCVSHPIMYPGEEQIIWSCGAWSAKRSYQVVQLSRTAPYFDLIIYDGPIFEDAKYLETVQITVDNVGGQKLTGSGQTSSGRSIRVRAFYSNVAFDVDDDEFGPGSGRCNRNVELN